MSNNDKNKLESPARSRVQTASDQRPSVESSKRTFVEIYCEKELNFPKFVRSDLSKFTARVIGIQKNVISPTEYIIEIHISCITPPIRRYKRYTEFRAFYKALKLRFVNVGWPEFPPKIQFIKKIETRVNVFNQILDKIFETMKIGSTFKKSLLTIFYAFFLEPGVYQPIRKDNKKTIYMSSPQKMDSPPKEDSDHEDSLNEEEALRMSILDFERAKSNMGNENGEEEEEGAAESVYTDETQSNNSFLAKKSFGTNIQNTPKFLVKIPELEMHHEESKVEKSIGQREKDIDVEEEFMENLDLDIEQHQRQRLLVPFEVKNFNTNQSVVDTFSFDASFQTKFNKESLLEQEKKYSTVSGPTTRKSDTIHQAPKTSFNSRKFSANNETKTSFGDNVKQSKAGKSAEEEAAKSVNDINKQRKNSTKAGEKVSISGNLNSYMKLSSNEKWNNYFAQLVKSRILLYNNVMMNRPNHIIHCYKCTLNYVKDPVGDYIEISHPNDSEKLYLAISLTTHPRKTSSENNSTLIEWFDQLKLAREDASGLENMVEDNYSPIGKIQLVVSKAKNVKKLPKNALYYIRIKHHPFSLKTSPALVDDDKINWSQSFFLPISDTFLPIKLELICHYNSGWIIEKQKDQVLYTGEVLAADIITMNLNSILTLNLPLKHIESKKQNEGSQNNRNEDVAPPELKVKIKNLSGLKSLFHAPSKEYLEGVKIDTEHFSKQLLKLGISRIKRIITYIESVINDIEDIFHCKYPFFSYLCILVITYMILVIDPHNLIPIFFMLITLLCVYKHPQVERKVKTFMNAYFFADEHMNPNYHYPRIQTLEELIAKKDMYTEKWKYKLVDNDPLMSQIKKAKKSIIVFSALLMNIAGFFEKLKNIVTWHDPIKTLWFIGFTFVAYCAFSVIPLRFILVIASSLVWANLLQGTSFFRRRYLHNLDISKRSVEFLVKKCFPNHYHQVSKNPTMPWPSHNFENFQKRMIKELGQILELNLTDDAFVIFGTPKELVLGISTCSKFLKFKNEPKEEPIGGKPKKLTITKRLLYFIMNVPSDYYRVINPKRVDIHEDWRKIPDNSKEIQDVKMNKARNFEITLIIGFITIYEIYLMLTFYTN